MLVVLALLVQMVGASAVPQAAFAVEAIPALTVAQGTIQGQELLQHPSKNASELARAVMKAKTTESRKLAMHRLMGALDEAVQDDRTGDWVVPGTETAELRAPLYEFDLTAISWAIAHHRRVPLTVVVNGLNEAGYHEAGLTVTEANLAQAITTAARLSGSKRLKDAHGWLGIRVAREAGMTEHRDLATTNPTTLKWLDPLQAMLITLDFTVPLVRAADAPIVTGAPKALSRTTKQMVRLAPAFNPADCEKLKPILRRAVLLVGGVLSTWVVKNVYISTPVVGRVIPIEAMTKTVAKIWPKLALHSICCGTLYSQ